MVNGCGYAHEPLFGLSSAALSRWIGANGIEPTSRIILLLQEVARELSFLANHSQDAIADEYRVHAQALAKLTEAIRAECDAR
jgi:hypothetical protein